MARTSSARSTRSRSSVRKSADARHLGPALLLLVAGCATAPPAPRFLPDPVPLSRGSERVWSGVAATGLSEGAAGTFSVHRPDPGQAVHSLAELAVTLAGVPATVLEVGWMVSPTVLGDHEPRLFVHAWRGDEACPQRCGFALMAGAARVPGDTLLPGRDVRLELSRRDDGWWVRVDGNDIGRFDSGPPATSVQWFGELLFTGGAPVGEMGSGRPPPDEGAARVERLCVRASGGDVCSTPKALEIQQTDPEAYPVRVEGRDRIRYGGGAAVRPRPPPS